MFLCLTLLLLLINEKDKHMKKYNKKSYKRPTVKSISKQITETIISCLEKGIVPWSQPYSIKVGNARNYYGKLYRGMNRWILNSICMKEQYPTNVWMTYKKCIDEGGHVLKGSKGTTVVLWKFLKVTKEDPKTGEEVTKTIPMLRTFNVFNISQTSLYKPDVVIPEVKDELDEFTGMSSQVISDWNNRIQEETKKKTGFIRFGYDNANTPYYVPSMDYINIPYGDGVVDWVNEESLHKVIFHEMMHSTGHKSRLDRFDNADLGNGDKLHSEGQYSAEELVAEMGAQILSDICGFKGDHIENTSAYIGSWIKVLKNNHDWILWASGRAEKGVDMILDSSITK